MKKWEGTYNVADDLSKILSKTATNRNFFSICEVNWSKISFKEGLMALQRTLRQIGVKQRGGAYLGGRLIVIPTVYSFPHFLK